MYKSGTFVPGNMFAERFTEDATERWRIGSLFKLLQKPHHVDDLVAHTMQFATTGEVADKVDSSEMAVNRHNASAECFNSSTEEDESASEEETTA